MSITKKGKFVGNPETAVTDTRFKASEDGAVKFGKGVEVTDEDNEVKTFSTSSSEYFAGVALEAVEKIGTDDTRDYDSTDTMKVLKKGIVYVELDEAVDLATDGTGLGCNASTGDFGTKDTYTEVPGELLEGGTTGDEVRVRINLP